MSALPLTEVLDFYQFTPGRRIHAARRVKEIAADIGHPTIESRANAVIVHDTQTLKLTRKWRHSRTIRAGSRTMATELDSAVDRCMGAIFRATNEWLDNFGDHSPDAERVQQFLAYHFPEGVGEITTLPSEDKSAYGYDLLNQFDDAWSDIPELIAVGQYVARLRELLDQYEEALRQTETRPVEYEDVRAAQHRGEDLMSRLVVKILGDFSEKTDEDAHIRNRLMAPIIEQNERIKESHKRRSQLRDVDPETGEIVDDDTAPIDDDAQTDDEPAPIPEPARP